MLENRTHVRRGRLLDDFLMAALDGAFALAEGDDVASAVAEDLDLDVPCMLHVFLHKHARIAEARLALPAWSSGSRS